MPEEKIVIQWEKLPDRLLSKSLECLMCQCMRAHIKEGRTSALSHCCAYMTRALTTTDDKAFAEDELTLLKSLDKWLDTRADSSNRSDVDSFVETHAEYIKDRVQEVLERATECPDFGTTHRGG